MPVPATRPHRRRRTAHGRGGGTGSHSLLFHHHRRSGEYCGGAAGGGTGADQLPETGTSGRSSISACTTSAGRSGAKGVRDRTVAPPPNHNLARERLPRLALILVMPGTGNSLVSMTVTTVTVPPSMTTRLTWHATTRTTTAQ